MCLYAIFLSASLLSTICEFSMLGIIPWSLCTEMIQKSFITVHDPYSWLSALSSSACALALYRRRCNKDRKHYIDLCRFTSRVWKKSCSRLHLFWGWTYKWSISHFSVALCRACGRRVLICRPRSTMPSWVLPTPGGVLLSLCLSTTTTWLS